MIRSVWNGLAKMPHAYIGMIGSRKRVAKVKEF